MYGAVFFFNIYLPLLKKKKKTMHSRKVFVVTMHSRKVFSVTMHSSREHVLFMWPPQFNCVLNFQVVEGGSA